LAATQESGLPEMILAENLFGLRNHKIVEGKISLKKNVRLFEELFSIFR